MAYLISSKVCFSQLMSRSMSAGSMSGGFGGTSMFRSSSKCSAHLCSCHSVPRMVFPSLSFIGRSGLLYFCDSFLVVSYNCFLLLLAAASSASPARLSMYLHLSALALLLTSLLASVKSSCALAFSALVHLLFTAAFICSLSWILHRAAVSNLRPVNSVFPALEMILQSIKASGSFSIKENAVLNLSTGCRNSIFATQTNC